MKLNFQLLITSFLLHLSLFSQGNLNWATYYGDTQSDRVTGVKLDAAGNIYIIGRTESSVNIATAGTHQTVYGGNGDAFVVKFDNNGNRLWATYFGGSDDDEALSLAIDPAGFVYIVGITYSSNNIAFSGHQNTLGGFVDGFLAKFNAVNGIRVWATYFGDLTFDELQGVDVDAGGNVYVLGTTQSTTGFALNGFQNTNAGSNDAFIAKYSGTGVLQWATYYGGPLADYGYGIAVDNAVLYVCGFTRSLSGISLAGHQNAHGGGTNDCYIAKLDAVTGNKIWASYYGGTSEETCYDLEVDINSDVYLVGITISTNGISFNGHQNTFGGSSGDAFLVKFDANGNRLWATYYGGAAHDKGESIDSDLAGNIYLGASSYSATSIALTGYQNNLIGTENFYFAKFNSSGTLQCATYYGKSKELDGRIAVDANQNIYLAGTVFNATQGLAFNGFQNTNMGGVREGFLGKFGPCTNVVTANFTSSNQSGCEGFTANFSNTSTGATSWNWFFGDGNSDTIQNPSNTYLNAGQYTVTLIASDGITKDTLTYINYITIYPYAVAASTPSSSIICEGDSITFTNTSTNATSYSWNFGNGNTSTANTPTTIYPTAGAYTITLIASNINGCNDTLLIPIQVKPNVTSINNQTICNGNNYTLPGGAVVSSQGTYFDTLFSYNGCDSIITTNLIVVPVLTFSQNINRCSGNNYTLPSGAVVSTSGVYIDTINSSGGCDSIITTNLNFAPFLTSSQNPVICNGGSFTLPSGSVVVSAGVYIDTLNSSGGCDSIITTNLTVSPVSVFSQNISICSNSNYLLPGGQSVNTAGTYIDTILNYKSCDSIITTNLSVVNSILVTSNQSICNGSSYVLPGGNTVTVAGTYVDTLNSAGGCDSIITTNLSINPNSTFAQSVAICFGSTYTLPSGAIVNASGTYNDTLLSYNGCDSIISTSVSISPSNFATISSNITILSGASATLSASGGSNYLWTPSASLNINTGSVVVATPSETTTYCAIVTDNIGCVDTVCVTVFVEIPCPDIEHLSLPNAFSPNQDGVNDEFCIQGWTPCNHEFVIYIYDRWGEKVYESKDPNFCWDGMKNEKFFDAQVFVYHIKAKFLNDNKTIIKSGNISLIR